MDEDVVTGVKLYMVVVFEGQLIMYEERWVGRLSTGLLFQGVGGGAVSI